MARRTPIPVIAALLLSGSGAAAQQVEYVLDTAASTVVINVQTAGLLSFLGHPHEVAAPVAAGIVRFDRDAPSRSSVRVEFDARRLRVTGRGEPAGDVPEVQRTMEGPRVLDVSAFPALAFASRQIEVLAQADGRLRLRVTGDLTLHGMTRPRTSEVAVDVVADRLTATGTFTVVQSEFGIEPVTAGAGTVRVKDEVDVRFTLVGRLRAD
jgi:polyisoprenoid-binding protein YceI